MTTAASHSEVDLANVSQNKYTGEANSVAKLLETNPAEAQKRLTLDSHLSPHEQHDFLAAVKSTYGKDREKDNTLPELNLTENKDGYKVDLKKTGEDKPTTVFEKKFDEKEKESDKPIPMTGELLGLTKEQTQKILDTQKQEKEAGKKPHLFGDICVSLGFKTPQEVNNALEKQDHMKAARLTDDMSHSMPLGHKEGYFQLLKRTHPELEDGDASHLAHAMKRLNHNASELKLHSVLPVLGESAREQFENKAFESIHKRTGTVHAKLGQPLSEIPN